MSIDQPSSTFINGFLSNLQPGENVFDAIRATINKLAFAPPTDKLRYQVYILFGGHALILLLSAVGVTARYYRKSAWLFARDENGFLRPNTAIITQICFALYSLFFLVDTFTYSLTGKPTSAAFGLLVLTFIPLGAALHFTTWATAAAPATSFKFLSTTRQRGIVANHGRLFTWIAIGSLALFIISVAIAAAFMVELHISEYNELNLLFSQIDAAEASGEGIDGLAILLPTYEEINDLSVSALVRYRAICGTYFAWAIIWMVIYIPAAIRLLWALNSRKKRITRSLRSLKVLDDIVSGEQEVADDVKEKIHASTPSEVEMGLGIQLAKGRAAALNTYQAPRGASRSPPTTPRADMYSSRTFPSVTPTLEHAFGTRFGSEVELVISPPGPTSEAGHEATWSSYSLPLGDGTTAAEEKGGKEKKLKPTRPKMKRAPSSSTRSTAHVEDLERQLARTNRMWETILVQFIATICIVGPYVGLLIGVNIFDFATTERVFVPWTGWTFVFPGLAGSFTFCLFSLRGPRLIPTNAVSTTAVPPQHTEDYAPQSAAAPRAVRIVDPRDPVAPESTIGTPRSQTSSMAPVSILQRALGVVGISSNVGSEVLSIPDGSGTTTPKGSPSMKKTGWFSGSRRPSGSA